MFLLRSVKAYGPQEEITRGPHRENCTDNVTVTNRRSTHAPIARLVRISHGSGSPFRTFEKNIPIETIQRIINNTHTTVHIGILVRARENIRTFEYKTYCRDRVCTQHAP